MQCVALRFWGSARGSVWCLGSRWPALPLMSERDCLIQPCVFSQLLALGHMYGIPGIVLIRAAAMPQGIAFLKWKFPRTRA